MSFQRKYMRDYLRREVKNKGLQSAWRRLQAKVIEDYCKKDRALFYKIWFKLRKLAKNKRKK